MFSTDNIVHSTSGLELVRQLAKEGERLFTTARARQLAPQVGISPTYLNEALHHLAKSGWVTNLRKGLYSISDFSSGGNPVHEFEIAMALVNPAAISHWSALHYHGLTEQTPRKVFVLTTTGTEIPRRRGGRRQGRAGDYFLGKSCFRFVQVKPERFFGIQKSWVGEARVNITDPERTLLDGISKPQYCGDFAEVLHAFELHLPKLQLEKIINYALRMDTATIKRLGWVLETQGIAREQLEALAKVPIKGYRSLDPTGPHQGPCHPHWMIQENLPGKVKG